MAAVSSAQSQDGLREPVHTAGLNRVLQQRSKYPSRALEGDRNSTLTASRGFRPHAQMKNQLYSSLWISCDELRGGMDGSQYKDYVLVLLFIKYVSDKCARPPVLAENLSVRRQLPGHGGAEGQERHRLSRSQRILPV